MRSPIPDYLLEVLDALAEDRALLLVGCVLRESLHLRALGLAVGNLLELVGVVLAEVLAPVGPCSFGNQRKRLLVERHTLDEFVGATEPGLELGQLLLGRGKEDLGLGHESIQEPSVGEALNVFERLLRPERGVVGTAALTVDEEESQRDADQDDHDRSGQTATHAARGTIGALARDEFLFGATPERRCELVIQPLKV